MALSKNGRLLRVTFLVDARSTHAQSWISNFIESGHSVQVLSSYSLEDAPAVLRGAEIHIVPLAFSSFVQRRTSSHGTASNHNRLKSFEELLIGRFGRPARHAIGGLDLPRHNKRIKALVSSFQPDLVHAMRLPFEGYAAALASVGRPLIVSIWGNDLTLRAEQHWMLAKLTRMSLGRTSALHCDCRKDLHLAKEWGFDGEKPSLVSPSSGGVREEIFHPGPRNVDLVRDLGIEGLGPIFFNPRGMRSYVRNDTFFRAIPLVLQDFPHAIFIGAAMSGSTEADQWTRRLKIKDSVRLLPNLSAPQMADAFRLADVMVSPSEHDGTPNSVLEGLACGALPVAGDIESLREWIEHGKNGLLCDPSDASSLAANLVRAVQDTRLRAECLELNPRLIETRANYRTQMARVTSFYHSVIKGSSP